MKSVSLSPSFTDIIEKLGRGDRLTGITDHCEEIREDIAKIGSPKALNMAQIEALKPDLIFADLNENRPEELRLLQKQFKVISFDVRSVPAVLETIRVIGQHVEAIPEAVKLAEEIAKEKDAAQESAKEIEPVRTLILLWNTPYLTINFDTYISRLVETCGGYNIFHSDPLREFPVEIEDMIDNNPGLVLLPRAPYPFKKAHIARFRQYRIFSKVRIEMIDGKLFSYFGPKTADALKKLSALIVDTAKDPSLFSGTVPKSGDSPL